MHTDDLIGIAITATVALICGMGLDRLRQPAVVGYILAGVALGPTGFALVEGQEGVLLLAELGVLMLLFLVGMQLSLIAFKAVWKMSVIVAFGQTALGVGIMLLLGTLFAWDTSLSVVLGFVVALSSTAVVIKLLEQLNILRQPVGQVTIGILIAQDLAVVPMLLTIETMGEGQIDALQILKIIAAMVFLVLFIWALSRRKRIILPFSKEMQAHPDLVPLAGLVYCFGAATLTGLIGLSPVLGAFLAGLFIGNSTARPVMVRETRPVQAVLMMVFFLSIGLLIDLGFIWGNFWTVLLMLFLICVIKTAINVGLIKLSGEPWPHALIAGVMLAQIGEFSLVISRSASANGLLEANHVQLIFAVTALSLLVTPLWLSMGRRLMRIILLHVVSWQGTMQAAAGTPAIAYSLAASRRVGTAATWTARRGRNLWRKRRTMADLPEPHKQLPKPEGGGDPEGPATAAEADTGAEAAAKEPPKESLPAEEPSEKSQSVENPEGDKKESDPKESGSPGIRTDAG
jgi:CPA2 family monovalent cation:H+ antiporter-2